MQYKNPIILHELLTQNISLHRDKPAIGYKSSWLTYAELTKITYQIAGGLQSIGLAKNQRVAVFLPNVSEAVCSYFSISLCGAILVPINSALRSRQAEHIIKDCNACVLITNSQRFRSLKIQNLGSIKDIVLIDKAENSVDNVTLWSWDDLIDSKREHHHVNTIDKDIAAIFYTSGSTGKAKGVVLSHQNLVMGAKSVAAYLPCEQTDKMLAVLPISFDYGFSQLTIAFLIGAGCYLTEFVFENDLMNAIVDEKITTLALVPPLWNKLARAKWPQKASNSIRYFCNTGGVMPKSTLSMLRENMPKAEPFMMYGLTEAFRSCYLPPSEIDNRPTSFGRAIPNAEILVINELGQQCLPFEKGELVHRGVLVGNGYWNDPATTAEKFKPLTGDLLEVLIEETALWSGDVVHQDEDGYLYFHGRQDDMIKSSGYRISPQEIEEVLNEIETIKEAVVVGVEHPQLGQAVIAIIVSNDVTMNEVSISRLCRKVLPNYMVPHKFVFTENIPRNSNGKYDRRFCQTQYEHLFLNAKLPNEYT